MNNDDELDIYYDRWLVAKAKVQRLLSGPGGIMEMKQTISDKEKQIKELEKALRFAAGYISATDTFTDKHPQTVYDWLLEQAHAES